MGLAFFIFFYLEQIMVENKILDAEHERFLSEIARDRHDCKLCNHYFYERSDTTEYFTCKKGYFDVVDYGGADYPVFNWFGCGGKFFSFNPYLELWKSIYKSERESIELEIRGRVKDEKRRKKCHDFKEFLLEDFDKQYSDILVNSFEDLTTWEVERSSLEKLTNADSIAVFSFGFGPEKQKAGRNQYDPRYFYPGKSNEKIADLMQKFWIYTAKNIKLENIFAQWEVAEVFSGMYNGKKKIRNIAKPGKEYLDTKGVADFFVERGLGNFSNVAVFAHPLHMYRCAKTLCKSLKDKGYSAKISIPDTRVVPFDEESVQPWTRDIWSWILHEISSRAYARSRGDM